MASDDLYDSCLAILRDDAVDEDDKPDKLEELIKSETSLTGKALDNAVLDVLWRFRNNQTSSTASPLARHTVARRHSPAPWPSRSGTPGAASSPRSRNASPAPLNSRPGLLRMRSSQQSPFTSPKPSPRLPFAATYNPRSPSFETRPSSVRASSLDPYAYSEVGSDDGNWQAADDSLLNGFAGPLADGQMADMTPYDILRTIFRDQKSDDEIEALLEANGYDLSAAIASIMGPEGAAMAPSASSLLHSQEQDKTYLVGKSMSASSRPVTPAGQAKSSVPCRYWLSTGQCLRADCRFSHDLSTHVCKYWLAGGCLAGDSCMFSHDPSSLVAGMSLSDTAYALPPLTDGAQAAFEMHDYNSFPSLEQQSTPESSSSGAQLSAATGAAIVPPPPGFGSSPALAPEFVPQFMLMQQQQPPPPPQAVDADSNEDFPTLGAAALKQSKRHHGKRGHGHANKERDTSTATPPTSSSLADIVRMSPAQQPSASSSPRVRPARGRQAGKETSAAALAIPAPEHIPWLETGDGANKAYIDARKEAIRHGGARNKFLQSAAQAWNRNDVRAAKALSLRGQSENELMREAHREAAKHLFEERNKHASSGKNSEVYVDLHGLHPAEAVTYLGSALERQKATSAVQRETARSRYLYAIVGTGHHSKGGRDKVGKAIRTFLTECAYAYREFSVPGDRGGSGGILGIDVVTGRAHSTSNDGGDTPVLQQGKVRVLQAEDARSELGLAR